MKIEDNYSIKNESTFRIGGIVKTVAIPNSVEEFVKIIDDYDFILGNCSNVLFSSDYIDKKIILTKNLDKVQVEGNRIFVECGAKGPVAAKTAQENGLSGFEFMAGFPGSFGGMVYMNASAHNQAISDTFVKATLYDKSKKEIIILNKDEMKFGYRKSVMQNGNYILLNAEFELQYNDKEKIQELMQRNIEFRKTKQPSLKYGNAGSIFKNPLNDSAGRLLDLCGFRGYEEGGAKVFDNHANFIINYNNATSKDVLTLMNKMYSKVKEKYTIELEPEIKYIGDMGTEEYKLWEMITENTIAVQK